MDYLIGAGGLYGLLGALLTVLMLARGIMVPGIVNIVATIALWPVIVLVEFMAMPNGR